MAIWQAKARKTLRQNKMFSLFAHSMKPRTWCNWRTKRHELYFAMRVRKGKVAKKFLSLCKHEMRLGDDWTWMTHFTAVCFAKS